MICYQKLIDCITSLAEISVQKHIFPFASSPPQSFLKDHLYAFDN